MLRDDEYLCLHSKSYALQEKRFEMISPPMNRTTEIERVML